LRVVAVFADLYGCGHYRIVWPGEAVHQVGDIEVVLASLSDVIGPPNAMGQWVRLPPCDLVVVQRPTHRAVRNLVVGCVERGTPVVVDMDDDLSRIHPRNPAFTLLHPKNSPHNNWAIAGEACRLATMVTVSTPALAARYGGHGRVRVLRNCVPARYLDVDRVEPVPLTVGWAGSLHSHPDDLAPAALAAQRSGLPFQVVGDGVGVARALGVRYVGVTGIVPFADWPRQVAQLGIGLAPLAESRFNVAKSALKPLEMAAVGVPWVASPAAEYRWLHERGCGVLADRPKDWLREVRALASDPGRRAELSEAGRRVAETLTYENQGWQWAQAWVEAAAMTSSRSVRA
jgi:glycosyltransferase involved in cell wall biosynthesis